MLFDHIISTVVGIQKTIKCKCSNSSKFVKEIQRRARYKNASPYEMISTTVYNAHYQATARIIAMFMDDLGNDRMNVLRVAADKFGSDSFTYFILENAIGPWDRTVSIDKEIKNDAIPVNALGARLLKLYKVDPVEVRRRLNDLSDDQLLKTKELASLLGVTVPTIHRMKIPSLKEKNMCFFSKKDIINFFESAAMPLYPKEP